MQSSIFQKIEQAPKVDFGDILSRSFEFFKKIWQQGLYHSLITLLVILPFLLLIYLPILPMYIEMIQSSINGTYYEPNLDYSSGQMIGYVLLVLLFAIVMQVISIGVAAHFYLVCKQKDTGAPKETGGYFIYLKKYWKKILILSLLTFGTALLAALLCYIPIFYVIVPLQLIVPVFAFNPDLSAGEIIKACFKLGNKFWLILFGLIIISSMIAQLGVILCFIGVFLTAYFVHLPMYFFYKDTIGFEEDQSSDNLSVTF